MFSFWICLLACGIDSTLFGKFVTCFVTNRKFLNFVCFLRLFKSGTLADAVGLPHHGLQYIPGACTPSLEEATNGFRMLMPLLCSMESAMLR